MNPFTALPVVDANAPAGSQSVVLPHVADGGGLKTEIVLMNTTNRVLTGNLNFFSPEGRELRLTLSGRASNTFPYRIPANGVLSLKTAGMAPAFVPVMLVAIGYAESDDGAHMVRRPSAMPCLGTA